MSRVILLPALLLAALACQGCLDLLARALIDPSSLASDAAEAAAHNTARSLVSQGEAQSMMEVERTVNRLDELIASGRDDAYSGDLKALRDHVAETKQLMNRDEQDTVDGIEGMDRQNIHGLTGGSEPLATRRLGDPGRDPSHTSLQTYSQQNPPSMEGARRARFRSAEEREPFAGQRDQDEGRFVFTPASSLINDPPPSYGIDLETGRMRTGVEEFQGLKRSDIQGTRSNKPGAGRQR